MYKLPVWRGWTVDFRLHQFRKVTYGKDRSITFVEFASKRGRQMLEALRKSECKEYQVIRVYRVLAGSKEEALEEVHKDQRIYLEREYAEDGEETEWVD